VEVDLHQLELRHRDLRIHDGKQRRQLIGSVAVAIEEKLAAAMPDYQLAYMVRYGVYRLVNARAVSRR